MSTRSEKLYWQAALLAVALPFMSGTVLSAKMYKWVDENGATHFSQTPPTNNKAAGSKETVEVKQTSGSLILPTTNEGQLSCGDLKLPKTTRHRPLSTKTLNKKIGYWEKYLGRSRQALKRYLAPKKRRQYSSRRSSYGNSRTYNEEIERHQKPINEYQCAIEWAQNKRNELRMGEQVHIDAKKEAQNDVQVATAQMQRICGNEPEKYNQYSAKRKRYLEWKRCTRKYGAVIREMENKLRKIERRR